LRGRIISLADLTPSDEAAWRDLATRSVEPNPFFEVDFVVPASRHLEGGHDAALLVAEEAGRFHACVPVVRGRRLGGRCFPVSSSWLHLYGFLGTPLVAPERGVEAVGTLLSVMMRRALWPRIVVLGLFGDDGPIASYLRHAARELGLAVHVRWSGDRAVFDCQNGDADLTAPRVKRERRSKARQWRRLRDDWGEPVVVDWAGQRDASEAFLAIEAAGWKGRAGTALASRASDAAFFREVTGRFRDAGRLHLYALEANGSTLAMQTNLCAGGALFDWKVAYDEQFSRYSPGAQLQLHVVELARRNGLSWIDSCSDVADEHQLRLSATRRRVATVMVLPAGPLPRGALALGVRLMKVTRKLRGRMAQ
jgi:CelD/BcsL family acetyltransferase involved in cellulose biosynthesis